MPWRLLSGRTSSELRDLIDSNINILTKRDQRGGTVFHYLASSPGNDQTVKLILSVERQPAEMTVHTLVTSLDSLNRSCLDVCVCPSTSEVLAPYFKHAAICKAILSCISKDRHEVLKILMPHYEKDNFTFVDLEENPIKVNCFIRQAVKSNAHQCLELMLHMFGNVTINGGVWKHVRSVRIAELLLVHHCEIDQDILDGLHDPDVIIFILDHTQSSIKAGYSDACKHGKNLRLSPALFEVLVGAGRTSDLKRSILPTPSVRSVRDAAAKDDIDMLKLLIDASIMHDLPGEPDLQGMTSQGLILTGLTLKEPTSGDLSPCTDHSDVIKLAAESSAKHGALTVLEWLLHNHDIRSLPLVLIACSYCQIEVIEFLLVNNVDPALRGESGRTALHELASVTGEAIGHSRPHPDYEKVFDRVLDSVFDHIDDIEDTRGDTALHIAVRESNWIAARKLIQGGARMDLLNKEGMNVCDIAEKQDSLEELGVIVGKVVDS